MKRPKLKHVLIVLTVVVAVVAVNIAVRWEMPKAQHLTLEVTGVNGRAIETWLQADGKSQRLSGKIPAEFTIVAHTLSWEVARLDGPEKETFQVAVHSSSERNWGGFAESDQVVRGGAIGPSGLRRKRAWLGKLHER